MSKLISELTLVFMIASILLAVAGSKDISKQNRDETHSLLNISSF